jgi:two-component system KDP operon response regulator KdpE
MRVLVLDDDRAFQNMLGWALVEAGHEVASAGDGRTGLELVSRWSPDVILLDLRMPGMDGESFARRYRELPGPPAPIVVLSAFRDSRERITDAAAYVRKPFELDDLIALLSTVTSSGEGVVPPGP